MAERGEMGEEPVLAFDTVLDTRDPFRVHLENETISDRFRHTDSRYKLSLHTDHIKVQNTFHVANFRNSGDDGYESVVYALPLKIFLWKGAPREFPDGDILIRHYQEIELKRDFGELGALARSDIVME